MMIINRVTQITQPFGDQSLNKQPLDIDEKYSNTQTPYVTTTTCHHKSEVNNDKNAYFFNWIDFYCHSMIIMADPYDNIYSKKLNFSSQHTRFILDKILFTRWFPVCGAGGGVILYMLTQLYWYLVDDNWIYVYLLMIPAVLVSCFATSYILSANINVCTLILQTFDFWYKTYNILLTVISGYFLDIFINDSHFVWLSMTLLILTATLFICDAIFISTTVKNVLVLLECCVLMYHTSYIYFEISDVYWDPFDNNLTKISVKSTLISSNTNLVLFMLKPIFSQISRLCRQVFFSSHINQSQSENTKFKQRSYYLHKRPVVQWKMVNDSIEEQDSSRSNINVRSRSISMHGAM